MYVKGVEARPLGLGAAGGVQCSGSVFITKLLVKDSIWDAPLGCSQDCMGSLPNHIAMLVFAQIHHCVPFLGFFTMLNVIRAVAIGKGF